MKQILDFKHVGGPYGDCTSIYEVTFPEGMTVGEFITYIIGDYSVNSHDTWGRFELYRDGTYPDEFLAYKQGKIFFDTKYRSSDIQLAIFTEIVNKKITRIKAHGGWSRMDYTLYIER